MDPKQERIAWGKHSGRLYSELPDPYVSWMYKEGVHEEDWGILEVTHPHLAQSKTPTPCQTHPLSSDYKLEQAAK